MHGRVKVQVKSFTQGSRGELSVSQGTSRKGTSSIHGVRGWVDPRTGSRGGEQRNI
jgi:hypothetical protein